MATFKHISSKNADYGAAEAYLTFEHDEFTMKPTLDENGRLVPREGYRLATLNCGEEDFAVACLRSNLRYGKNQKREDVKSHHYIISFDPRDGTDNGLTVDKAQSLGEEFCNEHFPGHQAIDLPPKRKFTPRKNPFYSGWQTDLFAVYGRVFAGTMQRRKEIMGRDTSIGADAFTAFYLWGRT